jgi:acetyltransferase-like isoleucine patch superfamily enzyme
MLVMQSFYSEDELLKIGFQRYGINVRVSRKSSIYMAEKISLGNNVRIDDFCCLVGGERGIKIGSYVHIAFSVVIVGNGGVSLEDFVGISSRSAIYSGTDDFSGDFLTGPTVPKEFRHSIRGEVVLGKHVVIGTGSTILPKVKIGIGCSVGANSLVNIDLEPWGIYAGVPVKRIKERNKRLLELEKALMRKYEI